MSTDPTTLARQVLDIHDAWGKTIAGSDECARASDAFTSALRRNGVDLARAVIELTARLDAERFAHANAAIRIKCVKALAEKYETTARDMGAGSYGGALAAKIAQEIRTALNGDNK